MFVREEATLMALYTTEMDACYIGCGEPLIFLKWSPGDLLLFWCPACRGIWDQELLDLHNKNPRLYGVEEFQAQSLTLPSLAAIGVIWKDAIVTRTGYEDDQFRDRMRTFFGDRICFPDEAVEVQSVD
jgi:hypothetical protein